MNRPEGWRRWVWPLASRKVQVALATVIAAYAVELGFSVSEQAVLAVIAVGVTIILGIAIEDHGSKSAGGQ